MTANYDRRIGRARLLKTTYPFAAEISTFYERVCTVQAEIAAQLQIVLPGRGSESEGSLRDSMDVDVVLPQVKGALARILTVSPAPLETFIAEFLERSNENWAVSLQQYVDASGQVQAPLGSLEELVARILLDPYAALLASRVSTGLTSVGGNSCPRCDARPVLGILRPEGDGGKRFLQCSFCATEWEFRRIYCAFCGEGSEASLPVYVAEKFPHIRVEACDTCRRCLRTVDLTRDGNAVPEVDDLAAIPLALWAEEHGYKRIHRNLLGT
jgi:formate dehydrogenase accessory protein FdhE